MDEFDEIFEELTGDSDDPVPEPTFRATIRNGRLTLTNWAPWLTTCGPLSQFFQYRERAGVAIADLTLEGQEADELIVRFYSAGGSREEAERVLTEWATQVGYRRLWLADRVIDLEPTPERIGRAEVRCPTCRAPWTETQPEFWLYVHQQRGFPRWCPLCGCELPQWTVRDTSSQEPSQQRRSDWTPSDRLRPKRRTTP